MRYVLFLLFLGLSLPVQAQVMTCSLRAQIVDYLKVNYGEGLAGAGQQKGGNLIELFLNSDTKTFTILMTPKQRKDYSCVLSGGLGWQAAGQHGQGQGIRGQPWDLNE